MEQSQQLQTARTGYQFKVTERKRTETTLRELEKIGDTVPVYRAVGRMFLRSSMPEIRDDLDKRKTKLTTEAVAVQKNVDYLERAIRDGENNLRDFVQKRMAPVKA